MPVRPHAPTGPRAMPASPPSPPPPHVLVCGAGIVGTSTAFYLARAGVPRITLVDSTGPAAAASGRAGGFLARDWCGRGAWGDLAAAGFDLHAALAEEFGADRIGYRRVTTFGAAFSTEGGGHPGAKGRAGAASPAWLPGAARLASLGTPATTAQVHPRLLTEALLAAAGPAVEVVIDEVTALLRATGGSGGGGGGGGGGGLGAMLKAGGAVEADAVVIALGPWTGAFMAGCGEARVEVGGRRAHSIVLTPAPARQPQAHTPPAAALPGAECLFSQVSHELGLPDSAPEFYPRPDGTVYVCGAGDAAPLPASAAEVGWDDAAIQALAADAAAVAPALAGAACAPSACYLPITPSGLPVIGELPGRPGVFVAAGHSCWGVLTGVVTGREVAGLVCGAARGGGLVGAFAPRS